MPTREPSFFLPAKHYYVAEYILKGGFPMLSLKHSMQYGAGPQSVKGCGRALYTRKKELGSGSYGTVDLYVWRSGSKYLPKELAVKKMDISNRIDHVAVTELTVGGYSSAAMLPWTTRLLDGFASIHGALFVMEYHKNGTLEKLMGKKIPRPMIYILLAELIASIHCLHQDGIVHRDIKPSNILISADNHIRLADFGLAHHFGLPQDPLGLLNSVKNPKYQNPFVDAADEYHVQVRHGKALLDDFPPLWATDSNPWKTRGRYGTPYYAAPEAMTLRDEPYSFGVDYYAVGVIAHELLTGKRPYAFEDKIDEDPGNAAYRELQLSPDLMPDEVNFITRMLHPNPEERLNYTNMIHHDMFRGLKWDAIASQEHPVMLGDWNSWVISLGSIGLSVPADGTVTSYGSSSH